MNSTALQLIAEKLRRDRRGQQIRDAVLQSFEVVEHRRWTTRATEHVRCVDVYAVVAQALGILVPTSAYCAEVRRAVIALGAAPVLHHNQRRFRFMRPKAVAGAKEALERLSPDALEKLRRDWYKRAADAGFEDIERPRGDLSRAGESTGRNEGRYQVKREISAAFFQRAQDYYWRLDRDLRVWELYAIDGLSIREVEGTLGLKRDLVHRIVKRLREAMGGQPTEGEDDDGEADD